MHFQFTNLLKRGLIYLQIIIRFFTILEILFFLYVDNNQM